MFNKKNGIYYTPTDLAEYLASPLLNEKSLRILDPSYGEGALLLAAERLLKKTGNFAALNLYGCDIKPVNGLLLHLPKANLKEIDFFNFPIRHKFQTVLMNPPYVRHHLQTTSKIEEYRSSYPQLQILARSSDLWAYFLVKSVLHLEIGGNLGALLPWSFLQAEYARPLRGWLSSMFKEIKVVALSNKYFRTADERIIVLWLKAYGQRCTEISIGSAKNISARINFSKVAESTWNSNKVFYSRVAHLEKLLTHCKSEYGFTELSKYADVKIGVVTGAVDYFIMSRNSALEAGFTKSRLQPILKNSEDFAKYIAGGSKVLPVLISLMPNDHTKYKKFIDKGVAMGLNHRAHSKRRKPWYSVNVGEVPDAFFHYRVFKYPFLIPNEEKVQCTNSLHRIYFRNLTLLEKKWITVSIFSKVSQLSLEANSKVYGRAILKIEPQSLKNTLILKLKDKSINPVYKKVMKLISTSNKEKAVEVASAFITQKLKLPRELVQTLEDALCEIQNLRQG